MRIKRIITALAVGTLTVSLLGTNGIAATTSNDVTERELTNAALSQYIATQGMVLLKNDNAALPIAKEGSIALYGEGAYATYASSIGNAWVKTRNQFVNAYQGFQNAGYDVLTADYIEAYGKYYEENMPEELRGMITVPDALAISAEDLEKTAAQTDTAVYVITRHTAEGSDHKAEAHDYYLSDTEKEQIQQIADLFEKSIVVISSGNVIDTSFLAGVENLDAVLVMGYGGGNAGDALVQVLNGDVTPSGKLTDTWAASYDDYPTSEHYAYNDRNSDIEEYNNGIYVGYRYFDTFNVTPVYEFGYGLSYTDFDIQINQVTADPEYTTITATVTNTGDTYSGKEVVEIYFSAPDGELEKPYQELIAFAKTDDLAPGESQTMDISFLTTEMSSYSEEKAAYIMEAGDYIIRVGNSSRNTEPAAVITLDESVITEQLSNQKATLDELREISKEGTESWSDGKSTEDAQVIELHAADFTTVDHSSSYDDETVNVYVSETTPKEYLAESAEPAFTDQYTGKIYAENIVVLDGDFSGSTLLDVYNGTVTMEEFVSSLTLEQLAALAEGVGMTWGEHFDCPVEGAVGFTTADLADKMIPQLSLSDGASGLTLVKEYYTDPDGNWIGMKTQEGAWHAVTMYESEEDVTKEYPEHTTWYQYATQFGSGTTLGQSWDVDLAEAYGKAVGVEMNEFGVDIFLAPSLNIHTNPLGGRNFEYFSEDPVISGLMAAAQTKGVQSNPGAGVSLKHFAANNQETNRSKENNIISERAFREIYLKGFEIAVKSSAPMTIMSSYNVNNYVPAANDYDMLEDILRGEWGYDGLVETDWGGSGGYTIPEAMHAGNDLIMPGGSSGKAVVSAIAEEPASISLGDAQKSAIRILHTILNSHAFEQYSDETAPVYAEQYQDQMIQYCVIDRK